MYRTTTIKTGRVSDTRYPERLRLPTHDDGVTYNILYAFCIMRNTKNGKVYYYLSCTYIIHIGVYTCGFVISSGSLAV